jgi:sugar lactone lactonase YvrE
MWFSDRQGITIGTITASGTISEYTNSKRLDGQSAGMAFDGADHPWVIASNLPGAIGHLTTKNVLDVERLPTGLTPDGTLAGDASGNLWYTGRDNRERGLLFERRADGAIIHVATHEWSAPVPCCPNQGANPMTIGPSGEPWFTTMFYVRPKAPAAYVATVRNGRVDLLRLTRRGLIFPAFPSGIAAGASDTWVSGSNPFWNNGALWRITSSRRQTAYPIPFNPISLTVDSTGNPWFTAGFIEQPSQIIEVFNVQKT